MTDAQPLATRTRRASTSLPSRSRAGDDAVIDTREREAFLARAREASGDDAGVDSNTLSAIKDRLRQV